jgi:type I restriction enzyme S subunit
MSIPWLGGYNGAAISAKRSYELVLGKMIQPTPASASDVEVEYLNSASVQWGGVTANPDKTMWATAAEITSLSIVQGDLLVCEGGDVGRAAIYNGEPGKIFQNSLHRARSCGGSDVRYLKYLLTALHASGWLDILCNKATIAHFTVEKLGALQIPAIPLEEQRRIADFLDAETTRIDHLIRLRNVQVERLQEALLSEAGRIDGPDWRWTPLRRLIQSVQTGTTPTEVLRPLDPDDVAWYTPAALGGMLDLNAAEKSIRLEDFSGLPRFRAGSILIVGIGESLGKVADLNHNATGNQQLTAIKIGKTSDHRFVLWRLFCAYDEIRAWAQYSRVRILNNEVLKSFRIPVPALDEQVRRRIELDERLDDFRQFSNAATRFAQIATERRQALITAAVTGEITV